MPALVIILRKKLQLGFDIAVSWNLLAAIAGKILIWKDHENVDHHSRTSDRYLVRHQIPGLALG
jgi:hypothetical protein